MNLFKYHLWQKTKLWLIVFLPLIVIFLFIQPYISLVLFLVILGRVFYVNFMIFIFNKGVKDSDGEFDVKVEEMTQAVKNMLKAYEKEGSPLRSVAVSEKNGQNKDQL